MSKQFHLAWFTNFTAGSWDTTFSHGGSPWDGKFHVEFALALVGGALDRRDVDALHLHHRVEGPPCPGAIGIADQPDKLAGNDLPRHAEAVFHPAALLSLGKRRECVGEAIGFGLGLHRYLERDRFIKFELWSAIQAGERLTHQCKLDQQHVACLARRVVTRCAMDPSTWLLGNREA